MHGRSSAVTRDHRRLFRVSRRQSALTVTILLSSKLDQSRASPLRVTARSEEGENVALAHCNQSTFGVQFHPDSILTEEGDMFLQNFLRSTVRFER
ncbi:hypothetical protein [Bradyrhizobium sp. USDA 4532]|uniref:glutamine amidotransferase-related protein n=1 Tax=unclassified Bradyrhizobium TaxID=2631580 RepID=UPI0035C72C58